MTGEKYTYGFVPLWPHKSIFLSGENVFQLLKLFVTLKYILLKVLTSAVKLLIDLEVNTITKDDKYFY